MADESNQNQILLIYGKAISVALIIKGVNQFLNSSIIKGIAIKIL